MPVIKQEKHSKSKQRRWLSFVMCDCGIEFLTLRKLALSHPVYCISCRSRRRNSVICQQTNLKRVPDFSQLEDAELCGFIVGDGHVDRKGTVTVLCRRHEIFVLTAMFEKVFGEKPHVCLQKKSGNQITDIYHVRLTRKKFLAWAQFVGLVDKITNKKTVPEPVLNGSMEIKQAFLRGLFEADAGVHKNSGGVEFVQKDKDIVDFVVGVLNELSMNPQLSKYCHKDGRVWYKVRVRKSLCNLYSEHVGFLTESKKGQLEVCCAH